MNNKYTNKETSKQLKEWGCLLESDKSWYAKWNSFDMYDIPPNFNLGISRQDTYERIENGIESYKREYPAYDLLWDVCIKYALQFFGEQIFVTQKRARDMLDLLGNKKIKEANEYLLEHTIFNPKNK